MSFVKDSFLEIPEREFSYNSGFCQVQQLRLLSQAKPSQKSVADFVELLWVVNGASMKRSLVQKRVST